MSRDMFSVNRTNRRLLKVHHDVYHQTHPALYGQWIVWAPIPDRETDPEF